MEMQALKRGLLGGLLGVVAGLAYAEDLIEGYWKSIDDQTGEPLSIIEIRQEPNGTYAGKILHRYSNKMGYTVTTCAKCPEPYKDKPVVGLKMFHSFIKNPNRPRHYMNGVVVDSKNGGVYQARAWLTQDGRRLHLKGYMGVSILGRTQVWLRHDKGATP